MRFNVLVSAGTSCHVNPVHMFYRVSMGSIPYTEAIYTTLLDRDKLLTLDEFSHANISIIHVLVKLLHKIFHVDTDAEAFQPL